MIKITSDPDFLKLIHQGGSLVQPTSVQDLESLSEKNSTQIQTKLQTLIHLLESASSLSAKVMSTFIAKLLKAINSQNKDTVIDCLLKLHAKPHDQSEMVQQLKKHKIDGPFALAIFWTAENRAKMLGLVELIVSTCSVDLMLTGQAILGKWQQYIILQLERRNLLALIQSSSNYTVNGEHFMRIIDIPL